MKNAFKADLRDANFVLWEQLRVAEQVLGRPGFESFDQAGMTELLMRARDFACQELAPLNQSGDEEGCRLMDGRIHVPSGFARAWAQYVAQGWGRLGLPTADGGSGEPYVNALAARELMGGANLAFMTYGGFAAEVCRLVRHFGSPRLQSLFCSPFALNRWNACLCITEPHAGTDVGSITSSATPLGDGVFAIRAHKALISAGSDDLVENQVYLLFARAAGSPPGIPGVSCFLVPKYRIGPDGQLGGDNFVRVTRLEQKMGLRGSATADLSFGEDGECQGYLLGELNMGLSQLRFAMNQTRMATGLCALGVSSTAYLNAAQYACDRVQGVDPRQLLDPLAPRLPIVAHADVRRMLLEMKCKVEGCRALVYRAGFHQTRRWMAGAGGNAADGAADAAANDPAKDISFARDDALVSLFTPLIKAYTTDQAWRICELAIQVQGGRGYTRSAPLEQYARDVKVLSIWEGTNYVQAADLLVSRIGLGRRSPLLDVYVAEVGLLLDQVLPVAWQPLQARLRTALAALVDTHRLLSGLVQARRMALVLLNATRFLQMMANVTLGWLLLEAAVIAARQLDQLGPGHPDWAFYQGKTHSARFFFANFLSTVVEDAARIAEEDTSALDVDVSVFRNEGLHDEFTI
jgi:acyl-CoA dehydrogenase